MYKERLTRAYVQLLMAPLHRVDMTTIRPLTTRYGFPAQRFDVGDVARQLLNYWALLSISILIGYFVN